METKKFLKEKDKKEELTVNVQKENVDIEEGNINTRRKLEMLNGRRKIVDRKETKKGIKDKEEKKEEKEKGGNDLEKKGMIKRKIEELNKGGKRKEENVKPIKRGRKKQSEKGILKGERSIKEFIMEGKKISTPKRKLEEGGKEGNDVVFGLGETPRKKLRTEIEVGSCHKLGRVFEKGKVQRMKEKFELGGKKEEKGMLLHSSEKIIPNLRNEGKESLGKEIKTVHEETKFNLNLSKNIFLQNGDFHRKKTGLKMDFKIEKVKVVHQDTNRWSGRDFVDEKSVPANQNFGNDALTREPITDDFKF